MAVFSTNVTAHFWYERPAARGGGVGPKAGDDGGTSPEEEEDEEGDEGPTVFPFDEGEGTEVGGGGDEELGESLVAAFPFDEGSGTTVEG